MLDRALVNKLHEQLAKRRQQRQSRETPTFRLLNKKQQNMLIMHMLTKINSQILKFNVKKLFQIWAIYHPEDTNCQIISQLMFKSSPSSNNIHVIRAELLKKNRKIRKNHVNSLASVKNLAGHNATLLGGEYCCLNASYTPFHVVAGFSSSNRCNRKRETHRLPVAVDLQLFRALDRRSLLDYATLFDVQTYHITDLPLLMCYTEYHVNKLIEICQRARTFPVHLLPRYLRCDVDAILRF